MTVAPDPVFTDRTVWTFWQQGHDQAPPIVQACAESWRRVNPGWRVVTLDGRSIQQLVDLGPFTVPARKDITVQKIAAIARLCLLRTYGGVWSDATVYCLRPLDDWLPRYLAGGFFAFRNPGPDRLASNWFIAAHRNDPILEAMHAAFLRMWTDRCFVNQDTALGRWVLSTLSPLLNTRPDRTIFWTNPLLQRGLRIYPYFIFHYTFNKIILTNPALRRQWEMAEALEAGPSHRAQALAQSANGLADLVAELATLRWPVQKLDWRVDAGSPYWRGVLDAFERFTAPPQTRCE